VFGVAAFMRLSIDLAAIGGLIAAIGTGVDDQIIITDEQFRDRKKEVSSRKRLKTAMYIIMIAYFTTLAAMIPLYFAGLKILQGFAFMIIIGVTVGVFITRPAFAAYLRVLLTTRKQRKEEAEEE
ncbi:MAG: MMPL family transporter, partial [Nanoarchaeota archaeon]|nr:MMPL family transporter [Nanoarchaeota archaeon]